MGYLERLVVKSELHARDVTQPGREPSGKTSDKAHKLVLDLTVQLQRQHVHYIPVIPFTADVGANAKDRVHAGLLDLTEEPHDVVVSREVVLKLV